jgi:hypothetical protein
MVRTWALLPDEVIFNEIWTEENQRSKSDKIIKETAVDASLLRSFNNKTRSMSYVSMQNKYTTDLREKVEKVKDQDQVLELLVRKVGSEIDKFQCPQSSNRTEDCSVCGDKGFLKSAGSHPLKFGVLCCERHFVCSACSLACYLSVSTQKPKRMSAEGAQQHFFGGRLPPGLVECKEDRCFALKCQERSVKFPVYWKIKSTEHYKLFNNTFMIEDLQKLIRNSVRKQCQTGCKGRDGDGRGTTSAIVTQVLRIENGQLWKRYCEKKKVLMSARKLIKSQKLEAKSTEISKLFLDGQGRDCIQLNETINELFLFHGTKEEYARSIAKDGFDPSRCSGLYGAGTYCADYSCKSMQYAGGETPAPGALRCFLVCRVLMGLAYKTKIELSKATEPIFEGKRFDSVFAGEGAANHGKQEHNEYVTYEKDQVYPEYLVYVRV